MTSPSSDRREWVELAVKLATPVLEAAAEGKLHEHLPVAPGTEGRAPFMALEAVGRLLAGLAPWLEDDAPDEGKDRLRELARAAIRVGTDPDSPDRYNFDREHQPVVDASLLAMSLLHAPRQLWQSLGETAQGNLIAALESTRVIGPGWNNHLLFPALIEVALREVGRPWDRVRVDYAIRQHEQWYAGDGLYKDGPEFHFDFYNSFIIHPYLLMILRRVRDEKPWSSFYEPMLRRTQRYAEILERLVSPEGTFPPVGRTITARGAVFHAIGMLALLDELPASLPPAQVRSAMTAVTRRLMSAPGTFDDNGWLRIGLHGHQPQLGEKYITVGSCYGCALGLLPLGLPPSSPFWSGPALSWTSKRLWDGEDLPADHAL